MIVCERDCRYVNHCVLLNGFDGAVVSLLYTKKPVVKFSDAAVSALTADGTENMWNS